MLEQLENRIEVAWPTRLALQLREQRLEAHARAVSAVDGIARQLAPDRICDLVLLGGWRRAELAMEDVVYEIEQIGSQRTTLAYCGIGLAATPAC
jgi:hypothetical protein